MANGAPSALLVIGALSGAVIALFVLRAVPRAAFAVWPAVLFLVPVWIGVSLGVHWPAIIVVTVLLLVVYRATVPLLPVDLLMAAFVAVVLVLHVVGEVSLAATVTVMLDWVLPYMLGRMLLARVRTEWVASSVTVFAVIAAVLVVIEFVTSYNLFVQIPGSEPLYSSWNTLQPRGGVLRAEGAFGHSIALGATLAMSCAFAIAAPWRAAWKFAAVTVIASATVLTFSRTGLITMVLTVVLSIWLLPGIARRWRVTATGVGALAGVFVLPLVQDVLGAAGEEAAGSAGYRTDLLVLLGQVRVLGDAGQWQSLVDGDYYLGYFARSVDNAVVLTLLRYGAVPAILVFGVIVWAALQLRRGDARSPASVAVMCQLPGLVVVALITQYGVFLWFCVGLALSWQWARAREAPRVGGIVLQDGEDEGRARSVGTGTSPRDGRDGRGGP